MSLNPKKGMLTGVFIKSYTIENLREKLVAANPKGKPDQETFLPLVLDVSYGYLLSPSSPTPTLT